MGRIEHTLSDEGRASSPTDLRPSPANPPYHTKSQMFLSTREILGGWGVSELGYEGLVEQEHVERDDHRNDHRGYRRGETVVDKRPHHVAVAAEDQQRDQGEGDAEGEHHLAQYQRATGVEADGEHDQRREHRDEAPQPQRDAPVDEPLHDDLAAQGAHRGAGEAACEEGDPEQDRRGAADLLAQGLEGLVYVANPRETLGVEYGGGHDEHAGVDHPGYGHGDHHVHQLEAEDLALLLLRPANHPALRQRRVQVYDVRHHRRSQDTRRQQHAVGPCEPRREEPREDAVGLGLSVEHLEGEGYDYHADQCGDRRLQGTEAPPLQLQDAEGSDGGHEPCREQRNAEKEVEGQRGTYELRQVGGHRYDLGLDPEQQRNRPRETRPAHLGEVLARGYPKLGRHRLDEHRHEVRRQDHPKEHIPVARPSRDIGGEVAWVNVGNRSDEGRPQEGPQPRQPLAMAFE